MRAPPDIPTYDMNKNPLVRQHIRGGIAMPGFAGAKKVVSPLVRDDPRSISVRSNLDSTIFGEPDPSESKAQPQPQATQHASAGPPGAKSKGPNRAVKQVDGVDYEVLDDLHADLGAELGSGSPEGTVVLLIDAHLPALARSLASLLLSRCDAPCSDTCTSPVLLWCAPILATVSLRRFLATRALPFQNTRLVVTGGSHPSSNQRHSSTVQRSISSLQSNAEADILRQRNTCSQKSL